METSRQWVIGTEERGETRGSENEHLVNRITKRLGKWDPMSGVKAL